MAIPDSDARKPVRPTEQKAPSSRASNPGQVRAERPPASTQSVQTPQGGNEGAGGGTPKRTR